MSAEVEDTAHRVISKGWGFSTQVSLSHACFILTKTVLMKTMTIQSLAFINHRTLHGEDRWGPLVSKLPFPPIPVPECARKCGEGGTWQMGCLQRVLWSRERTDGGDGEAGERGGVVYVCVVVVVAGLGGI